MRIVTTTPSVSDLTAIAMFIRARLNDTARLARRARGDAGEHWQPGDIHVSLADDSDHDGCFETAAVLDHVAYHDPATAFAAVTVHRDLVDDCIVVITGDDSPFTVLASNLAWRTLRRLATQWENDLDYRREWAL